MKAVISVAALAAAALTLGACQREPEPVAETGEDVDIYATTPPAADMTPEESTTTTEETTTTTDGMGETTTTEETTTTTTP